MHEGPEKIHTNPERIVSPEKKEIMEGAHIERLEILENYFTRMFERMPQPIKSMASVGGNFIPIVAEVKLLIEGFKGKTAGGRELNNTDRVLQVIAAATSALGKALGAYALAEGDKTLGVIAGASYSASWGVTLYASGKETIAGFKSLIEIIKTKFGADTFKKPQEQ